MLDYASRQVLNCPSGSPHHPSPRTLPPTGLSLLALPCYGSSEKELPFTNDRFDALATCHREGLRVGEGGVVGTRSLEANDSQEGLAVSRAKLVKLPVRGVHVKYPYSRVSVTSAFTIRTFRLSGAVVLS